MLLYRANTSKPEKYSFLNQSLNLIDIGPKCEKIIVFWSKMNFSVQGWGGGLFGRKKRVPFVVADGFWSMEIVSEPATPA